MVGIHAVDEAATKKKGDERSACERMGTCVYLDGSCAECIAIAEAGKAKEQQVKKKMPIAG